MADLIQTYLPNVYKMGWLGQAGWGTAIYLTLYMTVLSFVIGGFLGLVAGLFLVLTGPGGVLEDKVVFGFWIRLPQSSVQFHLSFSWQSCHPSLI